MKMGRIELVHLSILQLSSVYTFQKENMTPRFIDFFKSYYFSYTFLPPVDLSDAAIAKDLLAQEDEATALKAQQLISNPEVQAVLSEPLTYDEESIRSKSSILSKYEFKLLSQKMVRSSEGIDVLPFYSVLEHPQLPGWIIKSGSARVPKDRFMLGPYNDKNEMAFFTEEESLLRVEMAKRVAKIAREANIEVVVPKKKFVAYENTKGVSEVTKKYCVLSEKIDILSEEETANVLRKMDAKQQRATAKKISTLIQKAGIVDASLANIRLTPEEKIAIIDTEPAGLLVAAKSGPWNRFFPARGASVEKCARIGLFILMHQKVPRVFREEIAKDYETVSPPPLSRWKIAVSALSLGIIPLITAVISVALARFAKHTINQLIRMDREYLLSVGVSQGNNSSDAAVLERQHQQKRFPFARQYFAYTNEVPYETRFA